MKKLLILAGLLFLFLNSFAYHVYYVRTDGNDGNTGLAYDNSHAWATWAHAVATVAAGDTVYIAPGTYYELVTLATSGTAGSHITWWGDKEAQYFLDLHAGPVRITGCNSSTGIGSAIAIIFNCNSKTYQDIYNLVIDGVKSATAIYTITGTAAGNNCTLTRCIISGYTAIVNCTSVTNCVVNGSYYGIYSCTNVYNCYVSGAGTLIASCTNVYNTLGIGGYIGYSSCTNIFNCTASCAEEAFYNCTNYSNCNAYNSYYGFYYYGGNIVKCKSINCYYAAYGGSLTAPLKIMDLKYAQCSVIQRGSGYEIGTPTEAKYEGFTDISKLLKITTALKNDIFEADWSTDIANYTISGQTNTPLMPDVYGVTTPATNINDYYLETGTYNSALYYVNSTQTYIIFKSTTLRAGSYVICAGTSANESATNYAYCATLAGTYTNVGTFAGTIVCNSNTSNTNQDFYSTGTYNSQNYYVDYFKNFVLFYSSTLQVNKWVVTTGNSPTLADAHATNYAYSNTITGTYTNVGTYTGTIVPAAYTSLVFSPNTDVLGQPRRMGSGTLDCGAIEYTNYSYNYSTYYSTAPSLQINLIGEKYIPVPVKEGLTYTSTCWVKFNQDGGGAHPYLKMVSTDNTFKGSVVDSASGSGSTWQQLSVTYTLGGTGNGAVKLVFGNNEIGATNSGYAIFSDIKP